ncbi:MAG: hypothetical protein ACI841_001814 [Planctomycetota bacterium]|jgi:hypothetical protein
MSRPITKLMNRLVETPNRAHTAMSMRSAFRSMSLAAGCVVVTSLASATVGVPVGEELDYADTPLAIRAKVVHVNGGSTLENGVVVIQSGKISAVGVGVEIPDGAVVIEHDGDLSAGMIALRDAAGVGAETYDWTRKLLPEAEVAHAFDASDPDFEALTSAGVTSVVLTPHQATLAGGVTCVVKTDGGRMLRRRAHLSLSFSSSAISSNQYPTSYGSVVSEYEKCFADGKGSFAEAAAGRLSLYMEASARHEVSRAIQFASKHKLKGVISGATLVGDLAQELAAAGLGVVLPSFRQGQDSRGLRGASALAKAGVAFGFALDSPGNNGDSLRMSAAACIREGLPASNAWNALTADAAKLAGVDSAVGTIAKGMDADLVLWSGPPLDLRSRVEAVYVDGTRAYSAPEDEEDDDDDDDDEESN